MKYWGYLGRPKRGKSHASGDFGEIPCKQPAGETHGRHKRGETHGRLGPREIP